MSSSASLVVFLALFFAGLASLCMIVSVSTDHWEVIEFDKGALSSVPCVSNASVFDDQNGLYKVVLDSCPPSADTSGTTNASQDPINSETYYLRADYGGIWRLCDRISDAYRSTIEDETEKSQSRCFNYITDYHTSIRNTLNTQAIWLVRIQNSAASCVIVSLLCLLTAALTATFGLIKKQVSACMVTGVMYIVSGTFAIFALIIMHYKISFMANDKSCHSLYPIPTKLCNPSRVCSVGWSMPLAWVAVMFFYVAFVCWVWLTRTMRTEKSKSMV